MRKYCLLKKGQKEHLIAQISLKTTTQILKCVSLLRGLQLVEAEVHLSVHPRSAAVSPLGAVQLRSRPPAEVAGTKY